MKTHSQDRFLTTKRERIWKVTSPSTHHFNLGSFPNNSFISGYFSVEKKKIRVAYSSNETTRKYFIYFFCISSGETKILNFFLLLSYHSYIQRLITKKWSLIYLIKNSKSCICHYCITKADTKKIHGEKNM